MPALICMYDCACVGVNVCAGVCECVCGVVSVYKRALCAGAQSYRTIHIRTPRQAHSHAPLRTYRYVDVMAVAEG
jgi:hypothetical protein